MKDSAFLKDLATMAADKKRLDQERFDERWDRLSAGDLSADEEVELKALASTDQDAGDAYEAFRPLGEDFQAGLVRTLGAETVTAPKQVSKPELDAKVVLPFHRRPSVRRFGGWGAAAAAVAALFVALIRPPNVAAPPWPDYVASLEGGVSEIRSEGADQPDPLFASGSLFELVLRPRDAVSENLATRLFLAPRGGQPTLWDAPAEVSSAGTVRVAGEIGRQLKIEPGAWTLWVAIGREGHLPVSKDLDHEGLDTKLEDPNRILVRVLFRIE